MRIDVSNTTQMCVLCHSQLNEPDSGDVVVHKAAQSKEVILINDTNYNEHHPVHTKCYQEYAQSVGKLKCVFSYCNREMDIQSLKNRIVIPLKGDQLRLLKFLSVSTLFGIASGAATAFMENWLNLEPSKKEPSISIDSMLLLMTAGIPLCNLGAFIAIKARRPLDEILERLEGSDVLAFGGSLFLGFGVGLNAISWQSTAVFLGAVSVSFVYRARAVLHLF